MRTWWLASVVISLWGVLASALCDPTVAADDCPGPYHARAADGRCAWSCGRGTRPSPASGECTCQRDMEEVGTDDRGRRICAEPCVGPYQVTGSYGYCVWSCSEGTQPHDATGTCVCRPGHLQTGTDRFGRRVCVALACIGPYHAWTPDGRCEWSCGEGTHPHASGECICESGLAERGIDSRGRRICGTRECPSPYYGLSRDGRCVFTCARGTQPDPASGECICRPGLEEVATDDRGRRICAEPCPGPYHGRSREGYCVWSCGEGTQPDDATGTCVCRPGHVQTGTDRGGRRVCRLPIHVPEPSGSETDPRQQCPTGTTGIYPDCKLIERKCPPGTTGVYPNCKTIERECPPGTKGVYPKCKTIEQKCPPGTKGVYPKCEPIARKCPPGTIGVYPNCKTIERKCPPGARGVYPKCKTIEQKCPPGMRGVYPKCEPIVRKCPPGTKGVYPNCKSAPLN